MLFKTFTPLHYAYLLSYIWENCKIKSVNSARFSIAFEAWFPVRTYWGSSNKPYTNRDSVSWTAEEKIQSAFLDGGQRSYFIGQIE